jgi:hypothetical protein
MKVETLRALSGSTGTQKEFTRQLKTALGRLVEVGLLSSWDIEKSLVIVQKLKKLETRG